LADGFGRVVPAEGDQEQVGLVQVHLLEKAQQALVRRVAGDARIEDFDATSRHRRIAVPEHTQPGRPPALGRAVGERVAVTHDPQDIGRLGDLGQRTFEALRRERLASNRPPQQDGVGLSTFVAGNRRQSPIVGPGPPDGLDRLVILHDVGPREEPATKLNCAQGQDRRDQQGRGYPSYPASQNPPQPVLERRRRKVSTQVKRAQSDGDDRRKERIAGWVREHQAADREQVQQKGTCRQIDAPAASRDKTREAEDHGQENPFPRRVRHPVPPDRTSDR